MGNRGCLHDSDQKIRYSTKRDAWVTCLLSFKERKRELMQPGQYTELFFLDEATALAAGHRPCAECRRDRYKQFLAAWPTQGEGTRAADIDKVLKRERAEGISVAATTLSTLPDGVMVKELMTSRYYLLHGQHAFPWTFGGYKYPVDKGELQSEFLVLTPPSIVATLQNGYRAEIHPSIEKPVA